MPADPSPHAAHSTGRERTPRRSLASVGGGSTKEKPRRSITKAVPQDGGPLRRLRVCYLTGARAEFGLMRTALLAVRDHPRLTLQLVVTGMHLDPAHGRTIDAIRAGGWAVDATVPWDSGDRSPASLAAATGRAAAGLAEAFRSLRTDVVMVVGDRVEAFAAASAAHLSGLPVAHVHGGDRALGQVDDALRHAITKLAHVHFPATRQSAARIRKLGEDAWRIHVVGSPGVDGIAGEAAPSSEVAAAFPGLQGHRFALLALHPVDADDALEFDRATDTLSAVLAAGVPRVVVVYPNNDPGSGGIARCWEGVRDARVTVRRDVPRPLFLGLLRDTALLVGNSSSGIIEAASFRTPVVDVGPRQLGRERCGDVRAVPYGRAAVRRAVAGVWDDGRPRRGRCRNVYGGDGAGLKIARILGRLRVDGRLTRKLIAY